MKTYFDHERLDVYQEAIGFCGWVGELIAEVTAKAAAKDQLDRASTSIPLNIAEGNGKFSTVDRARFLEMPAVQPSSVPHVSMFLRYGNSSARIASFRRRSNLCES